MASFHLDIHGASGFRRQPITATPITVGRQAENTIVLDETLVSRRHCVIEAAAQGPRVRDLSSSNGTFINGSRIQTAFLKTGDVLRVGRTEMILVGGESEAEAADALAEADGDSSAGPARPTGAVVLGEEEIEVLTPGDLVAFAAANASDASGDYEAVLLRLAESLPEKTFTDNEIALLTARGSVAHAASELGAERTADVADSVRALRLILLICFRTHASDIHFEPKEQQWLVRIRVDGTMLDLVRLEKTSGIKLTSLVKILSDIDIAQKAIVQEGHFSARLPDRRVDFRVSFAPAMHGQKCVVRILDSANAPLTADDLHMPQWMVDTLKRVSGMDAGTVLVCGPTGSGKTTTLYALIRTLDTGQRNVVTIEDPVEIQIDGVTQLPVKEDQGNTFASLLRSILRQDPDVILVGEIRDPETAKTALQAAITGHMVFSTVHTRDTVGAIFRLLDLGVEPFMLVQGLNLIVAQRLVRQLCSFCRMPVKLSETQIEHIKAVRPDFKVAYTKRGCPRCMGTGYAGRRGVYELLTVNEKLREVILRSPTSTEIIKALEGTNFIRLIEHGYQLVADGITSLEEVERAIGI